MEPDRNAAPRSLASCPHLLGEFDRLVNALESQGLQEVALQRLAALLAFDPTLDNGQKLIGKLLDAVRALASDRLQQTGNHPDAALCSLLNTAAAIGSAPDLPKANLQRWVICLLDVNRSRGQPHSDAWDILMWTHDQVALRADGKLSPAVHALCTKVAIANICFLNATTPTSRKEVRLLLEKWLVNRKQTEDDDDDKIVSPGEVLKAYLDWRTYAAEPQLRGRERGSETRRRLGNEDTRTEGLVQNITLNVRDGLVPLLDVKSSLELGDLSRFRTAANWILERQPEIWAVALVEKMLEWYPQRVVPQPFPKTQEAVRSRLLKAFDQLARLIGMQSEQLPVHQHVNMLFDRIDPTEWRTDFPDHIKYEPLETQSDQNALDSIRGRTPGSGPNPRSSLSEDKPWTREFGRTFRQQLSGFLASARPSSDDKKYGSSGLFVGDLRPF